jgi:membrane-bound serine protease (ClpP class)
MMNMHLKMISFLLLGLSFCCAQGNLVYRISIDGVINPVAREFIIESIERAEEDHAELLVIELDTPGGLMDSMHDIVKRILAAEIPVAVYISPSGSRSGSAGVFITMAAHIAAMAPGTNIGSAHPVGLGGGADSSEVMMEKIVNDAVAGIKSVTAKRGRNAEWAEKAVRESVNITETEALQQKVIDYVVPSVDSLLKAVDGKKYEVLSGVKEIHTRDARIEKFGMSWRQKVLDILSDPNIAYILMLIGIYGIFFELYNPGSVLPGVVGGICLILAFYSFQTLPVNYAGVMLILFAIILFLLEIKIASYGILSIGGIISLVIGSLMLIDTDIPFLQISWKVIIGAVVTTTLFFVFALGLAFKAFRKKPTTGKEGLVGEQGIALTDLNPEGSVEVHGEIWNAHAENRVEKGQKIIVEQVDQHHLRLTVKQSK